MRKTIRKKFGVFLLTTSLVLSGLSVSPKQVQAESTSDIFAGTAFREEFEFYNTNVMHKADGYSNGDVFGCIWRADNVSFVADENEEEDGLIQLKIDEDSSQGVGEDEENNYMYSGGEYRTNQRFGYGTYQVSMKPIKNDGVISTFFIYTGPSDNNPHDEIDIEFIGKDTTKVQFNYFTDGKVYTDYNGNNVQDAGEPRHEYVYDLGFDASKEFHTYSFCWEEDSIKWYVDGKLAHTVTDDVPSTPGRMMMSSWPCTGADEWSGRYDGKTPLYTYYDWISYENPDGDSSANNPDPEDGEGTGTDTGSDTSIEATFTGAHYESSFASFEDKLELSSWSNGGIFDCTWNADNAIFSESKLDLTITQGDDDTYYSGEYRTKDTFGYGKYQVRMKPIKKEGVATAFIMHAAAVDYSTLGEIDVFFNGTNTEQVVFKWAKNGVMKEQTYDLEFDASEDFHTYGFDWAEDHIDWYVDGEKLSITANENIPADAGRIMMNTWPGTADAAEWLGTYDGTTPLTASYDWFTYDVPETTTVSADFDNGKIYKIISKVSEKSIDVSNSATEDGANVLQNTYEGASNQKWYLKKQDNGYYTIENYTTGKVLTVQETSEKTLIDNGANVYQWTYEGKASQEWSVYEAGNGYYRIVNRNSEKVVEVADSSTEDNANIQQGQETTESESYLWKIEEVEESITQTEFVSLPLETELAQMVNSVLQEGENLSNGHQIGNLGGPDNGTATFIIDADAAGTRKLKVYYSTVVNRDLGITVNNGEQLVITCKGYGDEWYTPAEEPVTVEVELSEGSNTIVFGGVDGAFAPDIDRIEIELTAEEAQALVQEMINQLPNENELTLEDKMTINAVQATYDALEDKENIESTKLTTAVSRLTELENPNMDTDENGTPDTNIDKDEDGVVDTGNGNDGNETVGNETVGNETVGNETVGNETVGNETVGNETVGNETAGNEIENGTGSTESIPEEISGGLSTTQATQVITSNKSEDDPKGSTFATLSLRIAKSAKKTQKLKWNRVKGADGYMIFGNQCGKQMKLLKTINKGKTTSWTHKKLKKNTYYKYLILAYKVVDGEQITLSTSKTVHVPTTGGKYSDIKSVKVNKSQVTLKKGKTFKIKAKEVKVKGRQKINRHRKIYFESTNTKIATVSKKGKITAKKKGTCYVYAYAQNGVFKKIKVEVK